MYLDECVPLPLAPVLAHHGHDVTTAAQLGLRSRNDPFHLKYATEQKRSLVTTNQSDFRLLHRFWITMQSWEILASPQQGILATAMLGARASRPL
ncbi:MAG: DUF5615 family PIN-like protein [Deltaproteobacteria bacterium]|nr:DUF5615 family PIN-like protein [Deltaproteobacteria bacterium]